MGSVPPSMGCSLLFSILELSRWPFALHLQPLAPCPCNPLCNPSPSPPSPPAPTSPHFQERGSEEVRAAAARVVSGLARGGCAVLWADGAYNFDQAVRACSAALLDDGTTVRSVWRSGRCGKLGLVCEGAVASW